MAAANLLKMTWNTPECTTNFEWAPAADQTARSRERDGLLKRAVDKRKREGEKARVVIPSLPHKKLFLVLVHRAKSSLSTLTQQGKFISKRLRESKLLDPSGRHNKPLRDK